MSQWKPSHFVAVISLLLSVPVSLLRAQITLPDRYYDAADVLAGCYELTISNWQGALRPRLPRRVWLTKQALQVLPTDSSRAQFVMRAAPGNAEGEFEAAWWIPIPDSSGAILRWDSGFHGASIELKVESSNRSKHQLSGRLMTYSDAGRPGGAQVKATEVDCW
jgi:hypothetical protein